MSIKPLYEFDDELRQVIVKMHLKMVGPGAREVSGPIEGAYGEVYSLTLSDSSHTRVAAKCPRIKRFGSTETARSGLEQVLHELEKTHKVYMVPWVNTFFDVKIVQGWPFLLSRYHDGTLEDLIANPLAWSLQDRISSLIQIIRALRLVRDRGIAAHQDLKPGNVFFDDWTRSLVPKDSKGMHFRMFVGDFGLADAFKEFGRNSGSRPYMAPEQFLRDALDSRKENSIDVFALGVIAHEVFTDGRHPIGVVTADVFPWHKGVGQKWNREPIWRDWASTPNKSPQIVVGLLPEELREVILHSLSVDPLERPSLAEFEEQLWTALRRIDDLTYRDLEMQIAHLESLIPPSDEWPHMDEQLMLLRKFYSAV